MQGAGNLKLAQWLSVATFKSGSTRVGGQRLHLPPALPGQNWASATSFWPPVSGRSLCDRLAAVGTAREAYSHSKSPTRPRFLPVRGSCQLQLDTEPSASFPQLDVQPPSKGRRGVAAVRDIFRHDKVISVKEADPGIIRVRIGNVPDAVLRVKISNLVLTPEERYNYCSLSLRWKMHRKCNQLCENLIFVYPHGP
jgi:hypothetical protein